MYTLKGYQSIGCCPVETFFFLNTEGLQSGISKCIKTLHLYAGLFETPIDTLQWGNYLIYFKIYCYCAPYTRLK